MKIETRESVNQKIKDLRAYMAKDRAEKTQDGKRRGDRAGADPTKEEWRRWTRRFHQSRRTRQEEGPVLGGA